MSVLDVLKTNESNRCFIWLVFSYLLNCYVLVACELLRIVSDRNFIDCVFDHKKENESNLVLVSKVIAYIGHTNS